jgi:hypothetical protein
MRFSRIAVLIVFLVSLALPLTASAQPSVTYDSGIQVQNQGTDTAAIVVTFYDSTTGDPVSGSTINETITVAEGSKTFFPLGTLADGFSGSAVISSDQPVVAISNMLLTESGGAQWAFGGASYGGFSAGATTVSLPLIMRENSGFSTWFNVQNTGASDATVNITYSNGATEGPTTIKAGAAHTYEQSANTDLPIGFVGSATITSNQPVVATVVELGLTTVFAYNGFTGSSENVVMPLVNANNSGFITGIQIQNSGASSTDVTVAYTPSTAGTACTETKTIAGGESATFALYSFSLSGDPDPGSDTCVFGETFIGSAEVSANSASQPLVAIVNQLNLGANKGASYSGFDPANGTDTVAMPLIMDRNSDYWTGFAVVNVGTASTSVSCSFSNSTHTESATLDAGEALTALQDGVLADGYVGSATCTAGSGGSIVGIVNELNNVLSGDAFLVYNAFNQ